jgi:VIT1/CCC1 family predicted Fe2+/Mn2+ transporter
MGAFVGGIGKSSILGSGIKMVLAGVVVAVLVFLLETLSVL